MSSSAVAHTRPAEMAHRPRRPLRIGRWVRNGAAALSLGFILLQLVLITWLAFFRQEIPSFPPEGYSTQWFGAVFTNKSFVSGFLLSVQVAVAAAVIGLALAVPASLAVARRRFLGRGAVSTLLLMPLIVPGVVLGTSIYVFHIETEIATGLPLLGTTFGLVTAHALIVLALRAQRRGIVAGPLFVLVISLGNLELGLFLVAAGPTTLPIAILQY